MVINQLKAGAILSYVVIFLNIIVGLAYTPFMLRMMGQSEYGLYALVSSVITYLTVLDLGFGSAIIRYTASFRAQNKLNEQYSMFGMFVILYTFIGILAFLVGLGFYYNIEYFFSHSMTDSEINKAQIMMLLLSFNLAVTFPLSIFGSIISAYEDFVFQRVVQIGRIIVSTIAMVVMLEIGYKAIGLVVITTIFNLLSLLVNYWYCRRKIKIKINFRQFDWKFLKEITSYSFYIFLNAIMDRLFWSTGQFIIGSISGTVAVAIYSVAVTLEQMYMTFSTAITGVLLPKITTMVANNESNKTISDLFIRTGRIQFIVIGFILVAFILFGHSFIIIWAGSDYTDSYIVALIFFLATAVPLIQNVGITILQARNQLRFRAIILVLIALCCVGISIPLTYSFGIIGCAAGVASSQILGQVLSMNFYYSKHQNIAIGIFWKEIGKMSVTPLLVGICCYPIVQILQIDSLFFLICVVIPFTLVYVVLFWFGSLNTYEKDIFRKIGVATFDKVKSFVAR